MATAKMPIIYSVETVDGTVTRLVIVTAPGKYHDYHFDEEPATEADFNPHQAHIFDDPSVGVGYLSVPSQVADQYTWSIIEEASNDDIEAMKARFRLARQIRRAPE